LTAKDDTARPGIQGPRREDGEPYNGRTCTVFDPDALTPEARKFGKLPDMSAWRPADVVLFCPRGNVTLITDFVRRIQQRRRFSAAHSVWTHAALYVGDGKVIHVNRNDPRLGDSIGEANISDWIPGVDFRVRSRNELDDATRASIVRRAKLMIRKKKQYSTIKAFMFALTSFRLFADKYLASDVLFSDIVCSDVVAIAYDEVIQGFPVFKTATHQAALPATFSASDYLEDIPIEWCAIPVAEAPTADRRSAK
jgi:hypothetical protein